MANKEKIDYLLLDIRELETLVAGMRDAEVYPVSFFGQTFDLTHKILKDLHALETAQIEMLRKQMEEHQALIQSIPHRLPLRYKQYRKLRLQPRLRFRPNRSQSSKSRKSDRSFLQNKDYRPDRSQSPLKSRRLRQWKHPAK